MPTLTRAIVEQELLRELIAEELTREAEGAVLEWARENATIVLPTEGRQPFRPYTYQESLLTDRSSRRLILKARQTGISNAVAIEALHKAITRPDSTELFVSRNQDAASVLIRYCQTTLNNLTHPPKLVNENMSRLVFPNGSQIISLPATPSTGRSIAATDVYLDEFAFTQYAELIYESIVGTISTGGALTILSTPNGRNNLFFRLWSGLEGGTWSRHSIHWSDCPRYDEAWGERTKASMTRQSFAQEYDLDFAVSGDAVFDLDDLAQCRVGHVADPVGCERYITAWDIGRRQDHTVGVTIGRRDEVWHVVAYERMLVPYPVVQRKIEERARQYRGKTVIESNGVGDPVIENLSCRVDPYTTTTKTKTQAIQALQLLIQQGRFKHDEEQLDRELSLYQWDDDGLIQDSVMAAAIAAMTAVPPPNLIGQAIAKEMSTPREVTVKERLAERRARLAAAGARRGWR
jgi:hypothetical protein